MTARSTLRVYLVIGSIVATGALPAAAKEFAPGELRVCGAKRCVAITNRTSVDALSSFFYGSGPARTARAPRVAARAFELRFRDGTSAGMVGGRRLDRARVYGLNCGRFRRGDWYALPRRAVQALRFLTQDLRPTRITRAAPRSC
jgi:hypothetical protein